MTHQMAQLQLQPPTLRPDLRPSLLLHETIRVDPRRRSRSSLAKDPLVATPAAIAPPPYDTEYFNYDSIHLLSAKTLSTDLAPTTDSRLLWYMDSATSLYCTFDFLDIVNPVPLPEPVPIGSANGSIISATHCGRSHLSPLILVHYVPESKVSLGALTRQGFTYRAMTLWQASLCLRPPAQQCLDLPTPAHGPTSYQAPPRSPCKSIILHQRIGPPGRPLSSPQR